MVKIIHERKKCIGCGACASVCPEMFEMSKDRLANLKNSKEKNGFFEVETNNINCIKEVINVCPINIIKIQE
jgi:ferredoxin